MEPKNSTHNALKTADSLARLKAAGFPYATCPYCKIIYSLESMRDVERFEKMGCGICLNQQRQTEVRAA
jgi:hypothetical protein